MRPLFVIAACVFGCWSSGWGLRVWEIDVNYKEGEDAKTVVSRTRRPRCGMLRRLLWTEGRICQAAGGRWEVRFWLLLLTAVPSITMPQD